MSDRQTKAERLCAKGVIAVVRAASSEQLVGVAKALLAGGVDCIEITMTTPNALQVIRDCRKAMGDDALIGVGSVLSGDVARRAVEAGAQFLVSPIFDPEMIEVAHAAGLPAAPGCFSPTEIHNATKAGADLVKVFPATRLGPTFFKDILAPMPQLKLTPTGGVDLETAAGFIKAGAATLGVGSALVRKDAVARGDTETLRSLAEQFVKIVADARAETG
jgi:2-dehydro-3-deoxyphosphogluconate aldolase/(4S)-4-hydroxy-2-oxoglutarate aldolase